MLPAGAELIAWVAQQFNSTVTGRKPSLGAVLGLLSDKGLGKRTLEMQITCGIHSALPVLTNALVMGPRDDDALEVLQGQLAATIDAAVAAWEPDWAVATTGELEHGVNLDADGFKAASGYLDEVKYIKDPARSPFIEGSSCPPFVRAKALAGYTSELQRAAELARMGDNPFAP